MPDMIIILTYQARKAVSSKDVKYLAPVHLYRKSFLWLIV